MNALYNKANFLFIHDRQDEALTAFDRLLLYRKDDIRAWLAKSAIYIKRSDTENAKAAYAEAQQFQPKTAQEFGMRGQVRYRLGYERDALADYDKALEMAPGIGDFWRKKANILTGLGDLKGAEECFTKALEIEPRSPSAVRQMTVLRRRDHNEDNARLLEAAEKGRGGYAGQDRVELDYAWGEHYRNAGNPEKAIAAYRRGAKVMKELHPFEWEEVEGRFAYMKKIFPAEMEWPEPPEMEGPSPVFIVGMPRSGTTLLEQILASHSKVFGAGELQILPTVLGVYEEYEDIASHPEKLRQKLQARGQSYLKQLASLAKGEPYVTDKMPYNFRFLGLIRLMFPGAKILHARRHPVDNGLSIFCTLFTDAHGWTYSFEDVARYYGLYRGMMDHWRAVMPEGAFMDVAYEDVVEDPQAQVRRVLEYCGLPWEDSCLAFHKTKRLVQTASNTQVRQPIYKSARGRWKKYEPWIGPMIEGLRPWLDKDDLN